MKKQQTLANFNLEKIHQLDVLKTAVSIWREQRCFKYSKKDNALVLLKKIRSTLTDKLFEIDHENAAEFLNIFVEHVVTYKKIRSISFLAKRWILCAGLREKWLEKAQELVDFLSKTEWSYCCPGWRRCNSDCSW